MSDAAPDTLACLLTHFAESHAPLIADPSWPEPGVTVLLQDAEPEAHNGVWRWDGEHWRRPTEPGSVGYLVGMRRETL